MGVVFVVLYFAVGLLLDIPRWIGVFLLAGIVCLIVGYTQRNNAPR